MKTKRVKCKSGYKPTGNVGDGINIYIENTRAVINKETQDYYNGSITVSPTYRDTIKYNKQTVINEELVGKTIKDFSELKNYYKEVSIGNETKELKNQDSFDFITNLKPKIKFKIRYNNTRYTAYFDSNIIFIDDDGSITRNIIAKEYIDSRNVQKITQPHNNPPKSSTATYEGSFKKTYKYYKHIISAELDGKALSSLQLIESPNDHLAHNHKVDTIVKPIIYYDKQRKSISTFLAAVQYCHNCQKYFDFKESFFLQLKKIRINQEDVLTTILDSAGNKLIFRQSSIYGDYCEMREVSELYLYGYNVKEGVLNIRERQWLLDKIISNDYMSAAAVKKHISYLINRPQTKNTINAISKWKSDLQYINDQIKAGKYS